MNDTISPERQIELETMEATARSTKGLPVGQRCRAVGFQVVTMDKLAERFACKAIQDAQNIAIKAKLIADFSAEQGKTWEALEAEGYRLRDNIADFDIVFESAEERAKRLERDEKMKAERESGEWFFAPSLMLSMMGRSSSGIKAEAKKKVCTVRMEKLDEYMEEIPPRVFASLKVAQMCGLRKFAVAYPVLENAPQPDPVLVAHLGDKLLEIDMWE